MWSPSDGEGTRQLSVVVGRGVAVVVAVAAVTVVPAAVGGEGPARLLPVVVLLATLVSAWRFWSGRLDLPALALLGVAATLGQLVPDSTGSSIPFSATILQTTAVLAPVVVLRRTGVVIGAASVLAATLPLRHLDGSIDPGVDLATAVLNVGSLIAGSAFVAALVATSRVADLAVEARRAAEAASRAAQLREEAEQRVEAVLHDHVIGALKLVSTSGVAATVIRESCAGAAASAAALIAQAGPARD